MFQRFTKLVLIGRWPLFLAVVLTTMITGGAIRRLQIDPSMETLYIKKSPEYQYYRQYREKYGSDHIIAVAMATKDLFTTERLEQLRDITETLSRFEQVERVLSLANAKNLEHKFFGVKIVPAFEEVYEGGKSPEEVRESILTNELFLGNLVSPDGKIANILIHLSPGGTGARSSGRFIKELRRYLAGLEEPGLRFYVAGAPVEQYDFIDLIRRDQFTFVPMITILLVVTTWLIYRSLACMMLSMSIVFVTLIWSLGTISLMGEEINLVTSLLAPVIMIIAVVNSIHFMNLFFEIRPHHSSLRRTVVITIEQLGVPTFLTHFTTILGFSSLMLNPVPAIQSFGRLAALGTFYSYIVAMFSTPVLLPMLPYRPAHAEFDEGHFFNRVVVGFLEKLEFRWRWWILFLAGAGLVASLIGIRRIEVDTNLIKQMKPDLPLAVSTRFIDDHLTGVYSLGYVLRKKDGSDFRDASALRKVDAFKDFLESRPEITKANGVTTLIKKVHEAREDEAEAFRIPDDQDRLNRYFEALTESEDPELWKLISKDFREIRIEARMKAVGTSEGAQLEVLVRNYLDEKLGDDFDYKITGNVVLLGKMAKGLVHSQIKSFIFAFASILILIVIIFRSVKMGLLAAIPNIFPILAVYGLMGFLRIELSSTTAMIASIVLGMVVDASIHFLHRFRHEFEHRRHYLQSLHHTFRNVGQALVVSTLILVTGFASSVFANFRPTVYFGLLTSLTIFFALICTLVVLPVCLVTLKPFGPHRLFRRRLLVEARRQMRRFQW